MLGFLWRLAITSVRRVRSSSAIAQNVQTIVLLYTISSPGFCPPRRCPSLSHLCEKGAFSPELWSPFYEFGSDWLREYLKTSGSWSSNTPYRQIPYIRPGRSPSGDRRTFCLKVLISSPELWSQLRKFGSGLLREWLKTFGPMSPYAPFFHRQVFPTGSDSGDDSFVKISDFARTLVPTWRVRVRMTSAIPRNVQGDVL